MLDWALEILMIFAINIFSSTVFHNVLFVSVNLELHFIQLFRERLSEKMCTRQSRKAISDVVNTLFLTTVAVESSFVAFLSTRGHMSTVFRASSFKFLWKKENSKPPTMPFRIVACTFPDNLSRNSCIYIYFQTMLRFDHKAYILAPILVQQRVF